MLLQVLGVLFTAAVALLIAYYHRRQMRHIELFKMDPSVGLVPPPSRLERVIRSHWDVVFVLTAPILNLLIELFSRRPITRWTVFIVALSAALLATGVVMLVISRIAERIRDRFQSIERESKEMSGLVTLLMDSHEAHVYAASEEFIRLGSKESGEPPGKTS